MTGRAGFSRDERDDWESPLKRCVNIIVVDEAHELSNKKSEQVQAVDMLEIPMRLAVPVTPMGFSRNHFAELMFWLELPSWKNRSMTGIAENNFGVTVTNPFNLSDEHPASRLIRTREAIKRFFYSASHNEAVQVVARIWKKIMIISCHSGACNIALQARLAHSVKIHRLHNYLLPYGCCKKPADSTLPYRK